MKRLLVGALLIPLLSSCSFISGPTIPRSYYVLSAPAEGDVAPVKRTHAPSILVREATASGFINSQKILFSSDPIERRSYQYAYWTEPPPRTFTNLLLTVLDRSEAFQSVASGTSSAIADIAVNPRLLNFYHDVSTPPGKVVIEVRVELIAIRKAEVFANKTFRREVDAKEFEAAGAVNAFSQGVEEILTEIKEWIIGESRHAI